MNEDSSLIRFGLQESELPISATTLSGVKFSPQDKRWKFRDELKTVSLNFDEMVAPPQTVNSLKRALLWYIENKSVGYACNLFERFLHLTRSISLGVVITSADLINYRVQLSKKDEWKLGMLSGMLKRWHAMRLIGVSDDALDFLETVRLKGAQKGEAVLTMDPEYGRFTDIEYDGIDAALVAAYETGIFSLAEFVAISLIMILGARPVQYAALKICDLAVISSAESTAYILSVPQAKQRTLSRTSFKKKSLIAAIGEKVSEHVERVKKQFEEVLADPRQAPMFPAIRPSGDEPEGFRHHRTSVSFSGWVTQALAKLKLKSERTGELLNMPPIRFRRTVGSRAADEGHGILVIAELLGHGDTQNAGVYVEASPGMMKRIDRAMALQMAPMAQAFAGILITDESQARRAGDRSSRISDPGISSSMAPMGNCGKFGFCGALAPIACYTCRNFQPWADGPHEAVLEFLLAQRDEMLSLSDKRIAAINDRTILAVAEVVLRCWEIKTGQKGKLDG
jgi:hypothetical protein